MGMGPGFGVMFTVISVLVVVVFVVVIGGFIAAAVRGARQYRYNNRQPVLTVPAQVVSRRSDIRVRHNHHAGEHTAPMHTSSSTDYYATFQVQSGDRMEFSLSGSEYGLLAEGDRGQLTFQGTRYLGFERN